MPSSWFLSNLSLWPCVGALILSGAGVVGLYRAWRQAQRHWPLLALSWGLIAVSLWPAIIAWGADRALALLGPVLGLFGLLVIIITSLVDIKHQRAPTGRVHRPRRHQPKHHSLKNRQADPGAASNPPGATWRRWWHYSYRFLCQCLVIGLLPLALSLSLSSCLFALLDTNNANRAVYSALLVLLLWPSLMVWSGTRAQLLKPGLWFFGLSLSSLLLLPVLR